MYNEHENSCKLFLSFLSHKCRSDNKSFSVIS